MTQIHTHNPYIDSTRGFSTHVVGSKYNGYIKHEDLPFPTNYDNIVTKEEIAKKLAISPVVEMFSTLSNYFTFFVREFPYFDQDVLNVVRCWFAVYGKGLTSDFEKR